MSRVTATNADVEDAELFARARNALDHVPDLPSTVRVHIRDGMVTLTGSVERPLARAAAADAVQHLPGVQGVINRIVVAPPLVDLDGP